MSGGMSKKIAKRLLSFLKPALEAMFSNEARIAEAWSANAHKRLRWAQWCLPPNPEHFQHKIDLYWGWMETRSSFWVERGVYSTLAIEPGASVLELCCGDGFNAFAF